jgi:acyl carrier protein
MSKLTRIFSSVLGIEESRVTPELSPDNTPTWDSLNAIILLTEIEDAYKVKFEYADAMAISTFADVLTLVAAKGLNPHE